MEFITTEQKKYFRELLGIFLLFCSLWLIFSLFSYHADDPGLNSVKSGKAPIHNLVGLYGAYVADFLDSIFGIGALLWPALFACLGVVHLRPSLVLHWWRWTGFFLLTLCLLVFAASTDLGIGDLKGGGIIGKTLASLSIKCLSSFGSFLLWLFVFLAGVQLVGNFSWISLAKNIATLTRTRWHAWKTYLQGKISASTQYSASKTSSPGADVFKSFINNLQAWLKKINQTPKTSNAPVTQPFVATPTQKDFTPQQSAPSPISTPASGQSAIQNLSLDEDDLFAPLQNISGPPTLNNSSLTQRTQPPEASLPQPKVNNAPPIPTPAPTAKPDQLLPPPAAAQAPPVSGQTPKVSPNAVAEPASPVHTTAKPLVNTRIFNATPAFPSVDLLEPAAPNVSITSEDLNAKAQALMTCFNDFGVQGELARITPGPVVTMFEVKPAAGIRVSKIANLSDDLSLALKAIAVRIQAPIPGTDTVGIEIPNEIRQTVNFRELVECADFAKGAGPLTMILGKNIAGLPYMADLTRMPHMLVAGATGAGKSVCLNSILVSLLYRLPPSQMKLLLIDPKRIEMAVYSDLPHLVHPVVTEMEDAKNALDWAVDDMKNRYKIFERLGVRNIVAYHQKLKSFGNNLPEEFNDLVPLPYVVIVIDELADLMMTAAREVETSIVRLAQLARAAGIHMILATQRPSVDVVTGLIKANFPCRISFQVTSKIDSRTILDQHGAEHLLGRGDMLFKPSGAQLVRLHGPFLSDEEVQKVVNHWKDQLPPDYQVDFAQWGAEQAMTPAVGSDATSDPFYKEARNFILEHGRASISLIQRHLSIGYNRAARIMEQFEREGLVGPADGSKPRTVIR